MIKMFEKQIISNFKNPFKSDCVSEISIHMWFPASGFKPDIQARIGFLSGQTRGEHRIIEELNEEGLKKIFIKIESFLNELK